MCCEKDESKDTISKIKIIIDFAPNYFEIDPIRGLIRTKKALIGLARAHPYDFSVVASDKGVPSLSASTAVSIHVLESTSLSRVGDDKGIHIVSPSVHFTLQLDEVEFLISLLAPIQSIVSGFDDNHIVIFLVALH
ncbi:unnamed protein product [Onchocerca flexuosa]|uniref:Cadherin domain-containing protein n=1 Tax=Onchocerca flexuosa TaxID=387005 RepID=A0A183HIM4_9BILA|nr:unnamed protein product [Onchocerca flexuosa]